MAAPFALPPELLVALAPGSGGDVAPFFVDENDGLSFTLSLCRAALDGLASPPRLPAALRACGLEAGAAASFLADVLWRAAPPAVALARLTRRARLLSVECEPIEAALPRARLVEVAKAALAAGCVPPSLLLERAEGEFLEAVGLVPNAVVWKKKEA